MGLRHTHMTRTPEERLTAIEERLRQGSERMNRFEQELKKNTEMTAEGNEATYEIRDLMDIAKGGFRVLGWIGVAVKWLGTLAAGAVAIYAFFYAITHGGATPK